MAREILGIAGAVFGGIYGGIVGGPAGAAAGSQIGFMVGSTVGSIIEPRHTPGPKLGDVQVQTSRDSLPIPIVWGNNHVIGNLLTMNPVYEKIKKVSNKGSGIKDTTDVTIRTRTFAIGICRSARGPIGGILRVWENNKLVCDLRSVATLPAEDSQAFLNNVQIYYGTEDQLPDPELETHTGVGTTPCYRGLAYAVFYNKDITLFGSSIPTYRFEVSSGVAFQSKDYPADP